MPRATSLASSRLEDLEEACITAADGGRDCSCSATNTCRFLRRLSRWTKSLSSLLLIFLFFHQLLLFPVAIRIKVSLVLKRNEIDIGYRSVIEIVASISLFSFFLFFSYSIEEK